MYPTLLTLLAFSLLSLPAGAGASFGRARPGRPAPPAAQPPDGPRPAPVSDRTAGKPLLTDDEGDTDDLAAPPAPFRDSAPDEALPVRPRDETPSFSSLSAPLYLSLRTLLL